eukprot:944257-Prorocentrum_minimum.AAC.5
MSVSSPTGGLGAAGELTSSAGELTPSAGELTPSAGKLTPSAGELTPSAGELTPSAGELTPSAGKLTPSAGELTPSAGELTPSAGELRVHPPSLFDLRTVHLPKASGWEGSSPITCHRLSPDCGSPFTVSGHKYRRTYESTNHVVEGPCLVCAGWLWRTDWRSVCSVRVKAGGRHAHRKDVFGTLPCARVKREYTRGTSQPRAPKENIPGARANRARRERIYAPAAPLRPLARVRLQSDPIRCGRVSSVGID